MTSNDRVKKLFEKDRCAMRRRLSHDDIMMTGKNTHLGKLINRLTYFKAICFFFFFLISQSRSAPIFR